MAKKSTKSKLIETDKTKVEWELIGETGKEEVNKLIDFYKKDKKNARVVYHQDSRKYFFKRIFKNISGTYCVVGLVCTNLCCSVWIGNKVNPWYWTNHSII